MKSTKEAFAIIGLELFAQEEVSNLKPKDVKDNPRYVIKGNKVYSHNCVRVHFFDEPKNITFDSFEKAELFYNELLTLPIELISDRDNYFKDIIERLKMKHPAI